MLPAMPIILISHAEYLRSIQRLVVRNIFRHHLFVVILCFDSHRQIAGYASLRLAPRLPSPAVVVVVIVVAAILVAVAG